MDRRRRLAREAALNRLFAESDRIGSVERPPLPIPPEPNDDTGVGPASGAKTPREIAWERTRLRGELRR